MLPKIDARLQALYDLTPPGECIADIGADHGKLALHFAAQNKCRRVVVTDISENSVKKAKRLFHMHGLEQRAVFLCGDGLGVLDRPADQIVIAGMGGKTIARLLCEGQSRLGKAELTLSPQTDTELIRQIIYKRLEYHIVSEQIVRCNGRFYVAMHCIKGKESITEREEFLGYGVKNHVDPTVRAFLEWKRKIVLREQEPDCKNAVNWIEEELNKCYSISAGK